MAGKIVLITHQFSVVVKSMEKGLSDRGYEVTMLEDNVNSIKMVADTTEAFILYLHDSSLGDMVQIKNLVLLCDAFKDIGRKMIVIGSSNSHEEFAGSVPALLDYEWFNRPVNMENLLKEIEKESRRFEIMNGKKRILIIDDDPFYAKMISEWLRDSYQISMVRDGMEGISWLATHQTDLILLDYEMPVIDGAKVLEMLRMHSETSSIPVIFLTGIGTKESITRVLILKPQGYVLKSTTSEELNKTIKDFFKKQASRL